MNEQLDAIILGSGQGGKPLAVALSDAGKKTAVIESKHVGGTCINEGCTPTKTMLASARVAYLARRGGDYGVKTGRVSVEMARVRERKRAVVGSFRTRSEKRLESAKNVELIRGQGRFTGPKTVAVNGRELTAEWIFIDTGQRSSIPDVEGIRDVPILDNVSVMELGELPEHLVILGGGYVGLEFGQMFRRFGSRVTLIHRGEQLLEAEDADVAAEVKKILEEDGIEVLLQANTTRASGAVTLEVEAQSGMRVIKGSHLLAATGRVPNTDALHLEAAGIERDGRGFVRVNERLETNVEGVYALGDVNGGPAFTHISYDDYRIVKSNLLGGAKRTTRGRFVPYTLFIDPQLGRVGLTETEARRQGKKIRVAAMPMSYVARALETDETRGLMKIVVDAETEEILGAAVLGIEGGEIMSQIQIAMMGGLKYTALAEATLAHPTLAEALNNVFSHWRDEA
ncbi:MAG TPA: mercuric reductase [Acidobacteriaceae bacterium]|nr:mercuric reductase [Acidobacteriaceae bacterium]